MSYADRDKRPASPIAGPGGRPPQGPRHAEPAYPPQEELTPAALARHIAPEAPRHPAEGRGPSAPLAPPPRRRPKPKTSTVYGLWHQKPLVLAGIGAAGMVLVGLIVLALVALLTPDEVPLQTKTMEARLGEDPAPGPETVFTSPADAQAEPGQALPPQGMPPQQTAAVTPVLTASTLITAEPATAVPFQIAIDGTEGVPARSAVAIAGLPEGARLSSGRPFGADEWNLRTDEIGDLYITVPPGTAGSHELKIALVTAQGESIAAAETTLVVQGGEPEPAPAAEGGPSAQPDTGSAQTAPPASAPAEPAPAQFAAATPPGEQPQPTSSLAPPSDAAASAEEDGKWMVVTTAVNMREKPSSSGRTIAIMQKGKRLKVTGDQSGWLKVTDAEGGQGGWIYKRFLKDAE